VQPPTKTASKPRPNKAAGKPPPPKSARKPPPPKTKSKAPASRPKPQTAPSASVKDARPKPAAAKPQSPAEEVIEACEAELRRSPDDPRAARLHHEIGRVYETWLGEPRTALKHYQRALERSAEYLPSVRAARRLLLANRDHQGALRWFDAETRLEPNPKNRAYLLLAKGRVLEDVADQPEEARKCYGQAAVLDPTNASVVKALTQAEARAKAWDGLSDALDKAAVAISKDPRHQAAVLVQRARLHETHLSDPKTAIELYEHALTLDAKAGGATQALKRLLHDHERWQELVNVLEREASQTEDPGIQTMALYRIGRLYSQRLGDRKLAIEATARAAQISPRDALVLEELARLYEAVDDPAALATVLEALVQTMDVLPRRLGVLHRIAELYAERLDDSPTAIERHEAALQIDPTYVPALRALSALYAQKQDWPALVRMHLEEANASADTLRRATAHARIADLLETRLNRPSDATEHHAKALALAPGLEASFKALARLYSAAGKHRELVELYERAVERASESDVAVSYLLKIGSVLEDALAEPGRAIQSYRRVLEREPNHLGALHALQRAATAAARQEDLLEALELEIELCRDSERMVELLHCAGEVLDEPLGRPDAALVRYRRALELDPKHRPVLGSLGRLYHRLGRWNDLLETFEKELALEDDTSKRVRLLSRMAALAEQEIGDQPRALEYYRRVVQLDAAHVPALHALSHRLHVRKDWAGLVEVLETELKGVDDLETVAAVSYRLGEVLELQLDKLDEAVEAYQRAVKAVPEHRPSRDALARVHTKRADWNELVDQLRDEAANANDPRLSVEALLRGGEILSERLAQDKAALGPYEAIRSAFPKHLDALLALEPLYRRGRAWESLADLYRSQAESFNDPGARVAALMEVARLIATRKVSDDDALREAYAAALEHVPSHRLALEGLESMALALQDRDLLADVDTRYLLTESDTAAVADYQTRLGEAYEAQRPDRALAAYQAAIAADGGNLSAFRGLARLAERAEDDVLRAQALRVEAQWTAATDRAADLLVESARIAASLGDLGTAAADLERALERTPEHVLAAEGISQLLKDAKQVDRLVDVLSRAAHATKRGNRRAELWRTVAVLHADEKDDLNAGIAALERVIREEADHVPTVSQLAELYGRNTQWKEAADAWERVVKLGPSRDQLALAHLKLARILVEHLGDRSGARKQLEALLRIDGGNKDALTLLLDIYSHEGDVKGATDVGKRLMRAAEDGDQRAAALVTIGKMQAKAGERDAAAQSMHEAVVLAGPASPAAVEYKRMLGNDEPWSRYVDALRLHKRQVDAGAVEDHEIWRTFLELARVHQDELDDAQSAISLLREGLAECGDVPQLHVELGDRLRGAGNHREAIDAYQTHLVTQPERPEPWRGLAATFGELSREADAALALAPLLVLGDATDSEKRGAQQRRVRPGLARPASFADEGLRTISAGPGIEKHVEGVLAAISEGIAKLYAPDFDAYQVSPRDKLAERSDDAMRALCDRLAPAFGVERFEVYVHPRRIPDVVVELSHPASIMIPQYVKNLGEAQQVFMVGRAFALLARSVHPIAKLGWQRAMELVVAAGRMANPSYGRGQYDEDELDDLQRRLTKALPRRARKLAEEAAHDLVNGPRLSLQEIAEAFVFTANRAAAVLCGDLVAATEIIRQTDKDLVVHQGPALVENSPLVADLFRFWASEPALDFRRRAGLA
jgi:tetratricopeptide (TPR) repeat protein